MTANTKRGYQRPQMNEWKDREPLCGKLDENRHIRCLGRADIFNKVDWLFGKIPHLIYDSPDNQVKTRTASRYGVLSHLH